MEKFLPILKKCPLFFGISDESLSRMLPCLGAKINSYGRGQTVFAEGESAKNVGVVLSGAVQTVSVDYYGNRNILSEVGAGEIFFEAFACAEVEALPMDAVASERSEVMMIDCSHILHICENGCGHHHQLIYNLMRDLATKSVDFHRRIEITSKRTTREKLMAYLMHQARLAGGNTFSIPFDRQELADYLEVDRSGLSAEISKLRREGVIESKKNLFKLL